MLIDQPRLAAVVDLAAVEANVRQAKAIVGPSVSVLAVVKADAYGHGARPVAEAALRAGAGWLGVATPDEGAQMREWFPAAPICVFAPFLPASAEVVVRRRLVPFVGDRASVRALGSAADRAGTEVAVHVELDTGMGRSGVLPSGLRELVAEIAATPGVRATGLATHFPSAEDDPEFTLGQVVELEQAGRDMAAWGMPPQEVHCANSAAVLSCPRSWQTMVRPGLLMYGILPPTPGHASVPAFRPALTLTARIAEIRDLPAGHTLSYARTHTLSRRSRIAVIGAGYGDGYPRALSNRGAVLVRGARAPIVGRICMDVMLVDVTDVPGAAVGDEVVLIGSQGQERISAEEIARTIDTTEHDVTTRLTARVPRVHVGGSGPAERTPDGRRRTNSSEPESPA